MIEHSHTHTTLHMSYLYTISIYHYQAIWMLLL